MNRNYKITHPYDKKENDVCFVSGVDVVNIVELAVFIQFRAEELFNEEIYLNTQDLTEILFQYIEVVEIPKIQNTKYFVLDMHELRDSFCYKDSYQKLIDKISIDFDLRKLDELIKKTESVTGITGGKTSVMIVEKEEALFRNYAKKNNLKIKRQKSNDNYITMCYYLLEDFETCSEFATKWMHYKNEKMKF